MNDRTLEADAAIIYGTSSSPRLPDQPLRRPTNNVPEDAAQAMYGFGHLTQTIDSRASELWTQTGASENERAELRRTFVDIARSGVPEGILTKVAARHIDGELAAAQYRTEEDEKAGEEALTRQIADWNVRVRNNLISTYGSAEDAEALLARAAKFVRSRPALAKILGAHGLGSMPDIAEQIVAHVFSTGYH